MINQTQLDQVRVHEKERKNLQAEIGGYKAEAQRTRKHIFLLEREGDKYGTEAAEAATRYAQALEEVQVRGKRPHGCLEQRQPVVTAHAHAHPPKADSIPFNPPPAPHTSRVLPTLQLREVSILQLEQRISDLEAKLKVQQSLYEAVRSDRNLYSKSLIEAQEEIAEMKRKFKIMNHQIEQLKEEIHSKDKVPQPALKNCARMQFPMATQHHAYIARPSKARRNPPCAADNNTTLFRHGRTLAMNPPVFRSGSKAGDGPARQPYPSRLHPLRRL